MARLIFIILGCAVLVSGIVYLTCHVFPDLKAFNANRNIVAAAIIFRHGEIRGIQVNKSSNDTEDVQFRTCTSEFLGLLTKVRRATQNT